MKKISTKLTLAMLLVTFAVLAFVGASVVLNMSMDYYRNFNETIDLLFNTDAFKNACDNGQVFEYVAQNEGALCRDSKKECYILVDGNVVKSTATGGVLEKTQNLDCVLGGGVSQKCDITSDALDFAVHTGFDTVLYIRDTRADLYSEIRDISFLFLQAFLIGIALALLLSVIISKRLTLSVKRLEEGARKMRLGGFERVTPTTKDEVGRLCNVFNEMGEQIQADYAEFERIERSRREFVANVSHELKTPLTVIKSYSQTLAGMEVDAQTRTQFLSVIDSEADRMTDIVGQLLKLSKLESKSALHTEKVDIRKTVTELLSGLDIKIKEKSLKTDIQGECTVSSDRDKINTILLNLLTNAVKYSDIGGAINITMGDGFVRVRDSGIGISENDLPHIFERFYRTDKARGRDTGGTGLGLAIAKECADSIGATLTCASKLHKYTEFCLEFNNG